MIEPVSHSGHTRMIFMGEASLTDGFRLIGFETYADPPNDDVERLVRELLARRDNALLVIDQRLADADIPAIRRVRNEGGHIVVTTVPPLNRPDDLRSLIDDRLKTLFAVSGTDA